MRATVLALAALCSTLVTTSPLDQTFDYVVVGAGTAGLAIATRLAAQYRVAVIEAGSFYEVTNPLLSTTPGGDTIFCGSSILDSNPAVDWQFVTAPQTGAGGRSVHYARGKCMGGSSARNFMIYQRGTVGSYQMWADKVGDQNYTFANFNPYFKNGVKFTPPNTSKRAANASASYNPSAFSSTGGPLTVSYANYASSFSRFDNCSVYFDKSTLTFVSINEAGCKVYLALNAIGIPTAQDFNSGSLMGCQYCSSTIDPSTETRASSEQTYYQSAASNPNLKVFTLTLAKKVLFSSANKATGVLVSTGGVLYTLNAAREVIVSAGAFQSPQILMVSGIGPAATLNSHGIPVLVNNPNVGQNMWDHVFAGPTYRVNVETLTRVANDPLYLISQYFGPYLTSLTGPLTNPVSDFLGWEKTPASLRAGFTAQALADLAQFPADWPEIEYISGAGYVGNFADLILTQPKDGYMYATILATVVAPLSRGNVTIISADTNDLPIINPNWLTSTTDQQVAVATYKRARQAFTTPFMQRITIGPEYYPGPSVQTDADILKQYQNDLLTVWHAACTCAMGKSIATGAVIDSHARVFGVTGLRVVDASSFPILPPGHPQSTVYGLAEKIAANILAGQ